MSQPFLHAGQDGLVVASLDIDHAVRRQSGLGERWREQVWPCDAPQHLALGSRRNPGCEERGGRTVDRAVAAACDLMQGAKRQPTAGKAGVKLRDSERKHRFGATAVAFEAGDPLSKLGHSQIAGARVHLRLR